MILRSRISQSEARSSAHSIVEHEKQTHLEREHTSWHLLLLHGLIQSLKQLTYFPGAWPKNQKGGNKFNRHTFQSQIIWRILCHIGYLLFALLGHCRLTFSSTLSLALLWWSFITTLQHFKLRQTPVSTKYSLIITHQKCNIPTDTDRHIW